MSATAALDMMGTAHRLQQRRFFGLLAPSTEDMEQAATLFNTAGRTLNGVGHYAQAMSCFTAEADLRLAMGQTRLAALAYRENINILLDSRQYESAHEVIVGSLLPLYDAEADRTWAGRVPCFVGILAPTHPDLALDIFTRCEALAATYEHRFLRYKCLHGLADINATRANYAEAATYYEACFRNGLGDPALIPFRRPFAGEAVLFHLVSTGDTAFARAKADEFAAMEVNLEIHTSWRLAIGVLEALETVDAAALSAATRRAAPIQRAQKPALLLIKSFITGVTETEL